MIDYFYATISSLTGRNLVCDRCGSKVRTVHGAPGGSERLCRECVYDYIVKQRNEQ